MFQDDQTKQNQLWAFSHRDLVSKDSDAWLYIDLFQAVDLSDFDDDYETQGQAAKEPRLMLRTLFYGLTHGVVTRQRPADLYAVSHINSEARLEETISKATGYC